MREMPKILSDMRTLGTSQSDIVDTNVVQGSRVYMNLQGLCRGVNGTLPAPVMHGGFAANTNSPNFVVRDRMLMGLPSPFHPFFFTCSSNHTVNIKSLFVYPSGTIEINQTYSALLWFFDAPWDEPIDITVNTNPSSTATVYPPYLVLRYKENSPWGDGTQIANVSLWSPFEQKRIIDKTVTISSKAAEVQFTASCWVLENKV